MLNNEKCQKKCSRNLRKPTLPLEEKFIFTDDCPRLDSNQQRQSWLNRLYEEGIISRESTSTTETNGGSNDKGGSFEINKFDCLWQTKYKLHDCFSTCLAWMQKKAKLLTKANITTQKNNIILRQEEFNPRLHCVGYKEFIHDSPCFFVIE